MGGVGERGRQRVWVRSGMGRRGGSGTAEITP